MYSFYNLTLLFETGAELRGAEKQGKFSRVIYELRALAGT